MPFITTFQFSGTPNIDRRRQQVQVDHGPFAGNSRITQIDIDASEYSYRVATFEILGINLTLLRR